jgi:exodeoxyribonuclease VII large subunit
MTEPSPRIFSVGELNRTAKNMLEHELGPVWVEGEISKCTYASSGHLYFTLADDSSSLDGAMWRNGVRRMPFRVERGMRVQVYGSLTIYERAGRYQVIADTIRDAGLGDLMRRLEQLKRKLADEGLFDDDRKRALPFLPRRVGIVTSRTGAAVGDICQTIRRRAPSVSILLSPAKVQGEGAADDIMRALQRLVESGDCDVVIVGRGGGSVEDLMAFNDEGLVRAVAAYPIPIVSAVGHEVDFSLCDFAADRRAKTPTEAGEFVAPDVVSMRSEIEGLKQRGAGAVRRHLRDFALDLGETERRLHACHPRARLERSKAELKALSQRLDDHIARRLERSRATIGQLSGRLDALSPLKVLERGYAVVRHGKTGQILQNATQASVGDPLRIRLAEGDLSAVVT